MPPDLSITVPADITRVILDIQRAAVTPGDSDDLTTVPPAASIKYQGATYTITADKKAAVNGTPVANTNGVATLKLVKQPKINTPPGVYQFNGRIGMVQSHQRAVVHLSLVIQVSVLLHL
jgi:hypothetical protein